MTNDMSLWALVDCGVSNNFVRRQSLDNSKLKYIEREIPPTRITVRLATGAFVTVIERVVKVTYTLKEVQYGDDFIVLDLDTSLMSSLVYRGSEGTSHKSAGDIKCPGQ